MNVKKWFFISFFFFFLFIFLYQLSTMKFTFLKHNMEDITNFEKHSSSDIKIFNVR